MSESFTEKSLPEAVRWLFEANGYSVVGPIKKYGAEVDLVATQLTGLRNQNVYIEATVQYVNTEKYGKDLTKLVMFEKEVGAQRLIVSSSGFTPDVRERAFEAGIDTYTYDELFRSFERTEPYVEEIVGDVGIGAALASLDSLYEEPFFDDKHGSDRATSFLDRWIREPDANSNWLVVVGEYGTGKTALTQVLQRRWSEAFHRGEGVPLPFRIELRDFTRQFDARGLLHHFLDRNNLSHLPVTFVESMIARGRVVLLLDGYDEMAQYLNVRERRACLEALADLASDGARGILTSRPNYFSEAEELRVFEVLYQQIASLSALDRAAIEEEQRLDGIFERFLLSRFERELRDLGPDQTESLVRRHLAGDEAGAAVVIELLRRVFREAGEEPGLSLGGKPVIVSYLLDVVAELKDSPSKADDTSRLSEWQIFDIIVENLMRRDFARTPELLPSARRKFLGDFALEMAVKQSKSVTEDEFRDLVRERNAQLIQRRVAEGVVDFADSLVDDLRSSATLTRSVGRKSSMFQFSHNSLREFLLTDRLMRISDPGGVVSAKVHITDGMRTFARAAPADILDGIKETVAAGWPARRTAPGLDQLVSLTWMGLIESAAGDVRTALQSISGEGLDFSYTTFSGVSMRSPSGKSNDLSGLNLSEAELIEVDFSETALGQANLSGVSADGCLFRNADLRQASLQGALLLDCDITGARLDGADFRGLDRDSTLIRSGGAGPAVIVTGLPMVGYLRYCGAVTDDVDAYHVFNHMDEFAILENILRNLSDGGWSQRRGLERRGPSRKNQAFARDLMEMLLRNSHVELKGGTPDLVRPTQAGRALITRVLDGETVGDDMGAFLWESFGASLPGSGSS